jgi:hypothetical protein
MGKKIGIAVGVIIAVVAIVGCLVPLKTVAYTVMVDYQDTETYYEDEPYEVTETYSEAVPLDYEVVKTSGYIDNEVPVVSVTLRNTDTTSGTFNVHFTIKVSCMTITQSAINMWSTEYVNDKGLYLEPGQTKTASYHADDVDIGTCDWSWNYTVTGTKTVEKQRTVTKYRQVEKQRTVTKQHPETRYKEVTSLDYLLHYY